MAVSPDMYWDEEHRRTVMEGRAVLERTSESIQRTNRVAIETENVGTSIMNELEEQREVLIRAKDRLSNMDDKLDVSRNIIKRMGREVLYNKLILILIIIFEILILAISLYLKLTK